MIKKALRPFLVFLLSFGLMGALASRAQTIAQTNDLERGLIEDPSKVIYTQDFEDFVFDTDATVNTFGENDEWSFESTGNELLYREPWGSGTSAGFRGDDNVLGYQHTAGTGDFTATLTLENTTGKTLESLGISYLGRVERADQGRSPAWTVEVNGEEVPGLYYSTIDGVDKHVFAVVVGLSIEDGEEFTISWSSDRDFDAGGASKQIGIADLEIIDGEGLIPAPVLDPPAGLYVESVDVSISSALPGATIYYTTDGSDPDNSSNEYTSPITLTEPTTIKAVLYDDGEYGPIAEAFYDVRQVTSVSSIAELKEVATPGDEELYYLTEEVVLIHQMSFNNTKRVIDATGGLTIHDPAGNLDDEYDLYDGITGLIGQVSVSNDLLRFTPETSAGTASSTGNTVIPERVHAADFDPDDAGKLIVIENLMFGSNGTFSGGQSITLTSAEDEDITVTFRTDDFGADYIGEDRPASTDTFNIVGYVGNFRGTPQITARFWADFIDANKVSDFHLTFPEDGDTLLVSGLFDQTVTIDWEDAVADDDLTYTWIATLPDLSLSLPVLAFESDDTGSGSSLTLTMGALEEILIGVGLQQGDFLDLKWTVVAENEDGFQHAVDEFTVTLELGDVFFETITISDARELGIGAVVQVEGVITRAKGDFIYMQDETAGLAIRQTSGAVRDSLESGYLSPGDTFRVTGELSAFASLLQINQADLMDWERVEAGDELPEPHVMTLEYLRDNGPNYQAQLVQVSNISVITEDETFSEATSYDINDGTIDDGEIEFRVPNASDTEFVGMEIPTGVVNFVGVVGQFSFNDPEVGFQLMLIEKNDLFTEEAIQWANLQSPPQGNIKEGEDFIVYAQVYVEGVTDVSSEASEDIKAWIGVNAEMVAPTEEGWTWIEAVFNEDKGDNHEYMAEIGSGLTAGTYYYVSRFQLQDFNYVYGGFRGGFWDGLDNVSGQLIVAEPTDAELADIPKEFGIDQNYPNPFNPATNIRYAVPQTSHVTIRVYNVTGQLVATLVNETRDAGYHNVIFDGTQLASGVYIYRMQAGDFAKTRMLMLIK